MNLFRAAAMALGLTLSGTYSCIINEGKFCEGGVIEDVPGNRICHMRDGYRADAGYDAGTNKPDSGNETHDVHTSTDVKTDVKQDNDAKVSDVYDAARPLDAHDATTQYDAQQPDDAGSQQHDAQIVQDVLIEDVLRDAAPDAERAYDAGAQQHDVPLIEDVLRDAAPDAPQAHNADAQQPYDADVGYVDAGNLPACQLGEQRAFYTGPDRTVGIGNCRAGLEACLVEDGALAWVTILREITPLPERCDGSDADCDSVPNNGYDVGAACDNGARGACRTDGQKVCADNGQETRCDAPFIEPQQERCDGSDANCNGEQNEGYDLGAPCEIGIGACQTQGQKVCADNGLETRCDAPFIEPQQERCDESDADCDGVVNNGYDVGAACEVGVGACRTEGTTVCDLNLDARVTRCDAPIIEPGPEECNGQDDDCNGQIDDDEGCVLPATLAYGCTRNGGGLDVCMVAKDGQIQVLVDQQSDGAEHFGGIGGIVYLPVSWSPDGRYIAFQGTDQNQGGLARINVETGERTLALAGGMWQITYSPVDDKIAYYYGGGVLGIFDVAANREIARVAGRSPAWFHDGQSIGAQANGAQSFVRYYFLEGRQEDPIADISTEFYSVAPDDTKMLYKGGNSRLYVYRFQTGQNEQVTNGQSDNFGTWLDNDRFVFIGQQEDGMLYVCLQEGQNRLQVTDERVDGENIPTVDPAGRGVAFIRNRDVYYKPFDGIETRITEGEHAWAPVFAPVVR